MRPSEITPDQPIPGDPAPDSRPTPPKRSALRWVIGLAAVVVLAGVGVFAVLTLWLNGDDAPEEFRLGAERSAASGASSPDAVELPVGSWVVEASTADDTGFGYRILEDVPIGGPEEIAARTNSVTGTATVADAGVTTLEVEVDMGSLSSGNSLRDGIVASDYLKTGEFPTANFVLDDEVAVTEDDIAGGIAELTLPGTLTIAGTAQPVEVALQAQWSEESIQAVGTVDITLDQFGITRPDLAGRTARNEVTIEFKVGFVPA